MSPVTRASTAVHRKGFEPDDPKAELGVRRSIWFWESRVEGPVSCSTDGENVA
eukprot:CAMPEP_0206624274 /NCGR_PEP_ID=MMETSP0325_2-20121206/64012_1 /ASSEMBLY_ACC=CAM_ASM_000347 /TAXON_ID=2866 /ORGANISM="Crypthecodinium cohnii, Strain Seligo" /LENGTH=52 /DNA_ID=CAMNT_0054148175 /DNA_START=55 /DNA_END=210 /DNA_ORIENTATION=-